MSRAFVLVLLSAIPACAAAAEPTKPVESAPLETAKPEVQTVAADTAPSTQPEQAGPGAPTPPPKPTLTEVEPPASPAKMPVVSVSAPTTGQVIPAAKAAETEVKVSVLGWDVGPGREHLCVSLDAGPCVRVDQAKRSLKLSELAPKLTEGQHVLAVIARHKGGEAVRPRGKSAAFAAVSFFVEKRVKPSWKAGDPLVIMLPPADGQPGGAAVIDYYVANAELADGRYLAQIALAAPGINTSETSSKGWPFRLENAPSGSYLLRVALAKYGADLGESSSKTTVKYTSKTMTGPLVDSTRTFQWPAAK